MIATDNPKVPFPPIGPIEFAPEDYFRPLDPAALFPQAAPLEVDLGCGDGSFLAAMAHRNPKRNFLGVERLMGRLRNAARKATRAGLANVRLLRVENAYVVKHLLPPASVSRLYILFPDPWPKRRHWPRRLIQPDFISAAAVALAPSGEICIKTDDADYFRFILKAVASVPGLCHGPWQEEVPLTDFERHYTAQGRPIHALRLERQP